MQQGVGAIDQEIGVFEIAERHQVADDAEGQQPRHPLGAAGEALGGHAAGNQKIEHRQAAEQRLGRDQLLRHLLDLLGRQEQQPVLIEKRPAIRLVDIGEQRRLIAHLRGGGADATALLSQMQDVNWKAA